MSKNLFLGRNVDGGQDVNLDKSILLKHIVAMGASGSGKTYLCKAVVEECVRNNIPVIAIDPQGDIASLGLTSDVGAMEAGGTSSLIGSEYWSKLDLKVWTPGSEWGLPLSLKPNLDLGVYARREDKIRAVNGMGEELAAMAGMGDEATAAGFAKIIEYADANDLAIESIEDVVAFLKDPPVKLAEGLNDIFNAKDRAKVVKNLLVKMNGPRRLLMELGMAINVDALFGYEEGGAYDQKKVRVSVICLNALNSLEEKQIFVAALARAVYAWMLQDPKPYPVGMFYVDEAAPFLPPVRKPPSKEPLLMLLRQARKYGVCMTIATQSPADIDYTGLGQVGTRLLGRMTTPQEAWKVAALFHNSDEQAMLDKLPELKCGQFFVHCPDAFEDGPILMKARTLVTSHKTLTLEAMGQLVTDEDRETFRQ